MGVYERESARYQALDVLRALALVSMVSLHVWEDLGGNGLGDSYIGRTLHYAGWIDGAFFFVALSGVVTGLVHRRVVSKSGLRASGRKLARRAAFLYVVHVALTLLIVSIRSADSQAVMPLTPSWSAGSGAAQTVAQVLTLHLEPDNNSVLPMYVFFLLWAILAVGLLTRGRAHAVIGLSVAMYALGKSPLAGLALAPGSFHILSWQLLFTGGLIVGWTWERERLRLSITVRRFVVTASVLVFALFLALSRFANGPISRLPGQPVDKNSGGLLAFVFAAAALVMVYGAIEFLRRSALARRALVPLAIVGSKGLPGFVTMVVAILVLQTVPGVEPSDLIVILVVVVCGLAELAALRLDGWRRRRTTVVGLDRPARDLIAVQTC